MDWRQPGPIKSVLLGIIGWLVGWLVTQFSQKRLEGFFRFFAWSFLHRAGFLKKFLYLEIFGKRSPNYPKIRHFDIFLKNDSNDFFGCWSEVSTKYDLQFEWKLFFRKICNLEIFDLEIIIKLPKLRFLAIFSTLHHWLYLIFLIMIGGHDV